jgi:hypothetical protein
MRTAAVLLAVTALAGGAAACGDEPRDRLTLRTPPERSSAQPLPEVEREARAAARAARVRPTPRDAERLRPLLERWTAALRRDRNGRAARYFALPAIVARDGVLLLETAAQIKAFNAGLPCGARLLGVEADGRFVVGTFRLTPRPQHQCAAAGERIRVAFALRGRKIAEWREVPAGAAEPGPARPETAPRPAPENVS